MDDHYLAAVQRALDFIEVSLRLPVTLEQISRRAGFSLWHFQRIFAAYTGEPLASYLRRRRLTAAAEELRTASRTIIDLALEYQFESHAAFTRAFRSALRLSPSEFRRKHRLPRFLARNRPTLANLQHLSRNLTMKPEIIELPALHLLGLTARFIGPKSPDANNQQIIPPLFQQFFSRKSELPPALDGYTYGACTCLPEKMRSREDELVYHVSISVAPAGQTPPGMRVWKLPALTYAAFQHRGPVARIGETFNYIYGTWLPRSDYKLAPAASLERYDDRFGDGGANSEMDILVPLKAG